MKHISRYITALLTLVLVMTLFTGCGSNSSKTHEPMRDSISEQSYPEEEYKEEPKSEEMSGEREKGSSDLPQNEQFIIRTGLQVETENFDKAVNRIEALAKELNGYIESIEASYGTTYNRNRDREVHYMLRIPKGNSSIAIRIVKEQVGLVVNEKMNTENVTKRIRDMKRDIDLLKAKEDRLIELSKRSDDIEALIRIETELATIISEREYIQAALKNVEHDVQYDFLSIYLREVRKETVVEEDNFLGDIKTAFRDSIDGLVAFFQALVIFIVRSWFGLLVIAIILVIIIWSSKKAAKKSRDRRLQQGGQNIQNNYTNPASHPMMHPNGVEQPLNSNPQVQNGQPTNPTQDKK